MQRVVVYSPLVTVLVMLERLFLICPSCLVGPLLRVGQIAAKLRDVGYLQVLSAFVNAGFREALILCPLRQVFVQSGVKFLC